MVRIIFASSYSNSAPYRGVDYYTHKTLPEYLTMQPPGYNPPPMDNGDSSLDKILSSNKDLIKERIVMLKDAMHERRNINRQVYKEIQSDLTHCQNQIFALENVSYFSMQRDWEQKKFDLWRELRAEQTGYFRDLAMIQKDLRETITEYLTEKQGEDLFK